MEDKQRAAQQINDAVHPSIILQAWTDFQSLIPKDNLESSINLIVHVLRL